MAAMRLVSVNVGLPREVVHRGKTVTTGIFKAPVVGRVAVRRLNVDGDGQADLTVHGGVHKAVYAYPAEHYDFWRRELGREELPWGTFGENLTVEGMLEDEVAIGDAFRVGGDAGDGGTGGTVVEISQPRAPCSKLALRLVLPDFPKRFLASGRVGFYLRVREEGEVGAGDPIARLEADPRRMTVRRVSRLRYFDRDDRAGAAAAAALPALSPGWREWFESQLAAG